MSNLKVNKIPSTYEFWGVKGIERLSINLDPNSKINVFIGNNGVGKTKALECLYQSLLFSNDQYFLKDSVLFHEIKPKLVFEKAKIDNLSFWKDEPHKKNSYNEFSQIKKIVSFPIIYIPAQERGYINDKNIESIKPLGKYQERKREYFENIYKNMNNPNNTSITEWFIQRAMSTNEYQTGIDI
ncbi:DUF2813 domain-containing protein [Rodentibacter trehalosifermentans]|uniref:DUF2813 domain-containing protein n=1 Tax=Rodentibacter trehalosifermentans TaxID=1908263 RepID=UPI001F61B362|nr:DUF2813 domain-containing protein [Rodentibacter trehalosifermentans]